MHSAFACTENPTDPRRRSRVHIRTFRAGAGLRGGGGGGGGKDYMQHVLVFVICLSAIRVSPMTRSIKQKRSRTQSQKALLQG